MPFDMVMLNDLDRYRQVIVIDWVRTPGLTRPRHGQDVAAGVSSVDGGISAAAGSRAINTRRRGLFQLGSRRGRPAAR
jgi:hypothetical protein